MLSVRVGLSFKKMQQVPSFIPPYSDYTLLLYSLASDYTTPLWGSEVNNLSTIFNTLDAFLHCYSLTETVKHLHAAHTEKKQQSLTVWPKWMLNISLFGGGGACLSSLWLDWRYIHTERWQRVLLKRYAEIFSSAVVCCWVLWWKWLEAREKNKKKKLFSKENIDIGFL